jgi:hypothetical protein
MMDTVTKSTCRPRKSSTCAQTGYRRRREGGRRYFGYGPAGGVGVAAVVALGGRKSWPKWPRLGRTFWAYLSHTKFRDEINARIFVRYSRVMNRGYKSCLIYLKKPLRARRTSMRHFPPSAPLRDDPRGLHLLNNVIKSANRPR